MKSNDGVLVPLGDVARGLKPAEGQLLPAVADKPRHYVSPRAKGFWEKLCTWYGASKMAEFGEWAPSEVCAAIDALRHRDDLSAVLSDIKQQHPQWPPTTPQLEAIIRAHIAPAINWPKLQGDLSEHILVTRKDRMSLHQRCGIPRWQWSREGVFVPPSDGFEGFFVPFSELP